MTVVELERFAYSPQGAFGRMTVGAWSCFTVERPWRDNQRTISCIPEGVYALELGRFHQGGYPAYELVDVPGRSLIKIHIANTALEVSGCVGVGMGLGWVHDRWAVTASRDALRGFMAVMADQTDPRIRIRQYQPGLVGAE